MMASRARVLVAVVVVATAAYTVGVHASPAAHPNFVLMMSDDTGWGDMGYNNGNASTPNLDQWAAAPSAIKFERFYAGSPICSPTRASFLTGRTPWRDCIFNVEYKALSFTETAHDTVAAAAKSKGYRTAHFGKWHLGSLDTPPPPLPANGSCGRGPPGTWCGPHDGALPVASPLNFGFDTFCSTPQCGPSASTNCVCAQAAAPGPASLARCNTGHYHDSPTAMVFPCQQYYHTNPAMNKTILPWPAASKDDDNEHLMDQFIVFMNASIAESKPFMGVIWFHSVHIPYIAPDTFRAQYAKKYDENQADYYGALTAMDNQIGRLRRLLRSMSIADDTMLVYTADNGPEGQSYWHVPAGSNPGETNGLRGRKRDLAEGGIRVPGLLEWPGMITSNKHSFYPAGTVDLKPTVMDILGITPPKGWPLDGTSLLPLIKDEVVNRTQPMGWVWGMVYGNHNTTGVCGAWMDEARVLAHASPGMMVDEHPHWDTTPDGPGYDRSTDRSTGSQTVNQAAWMEQDYKLFACNNQDGTPLRYFLYDLRSDPAEKHDLSGAMPSRVTAMKAALQAWIDAVAVSRGPKETNCAGPPPSPPSPPSPPPGPFKPSPSLRNCTFTARKTMPGSHPIKQHATSQEECCGACFATTWCVAAIFQVHANSCNMHGLDDVHALKQGVDESVLTGRA